MHILNKINYSEFFLILIPLSVLLRSTFLNFFLIIASIIFLYFFFSKKQIFNNKNTWVFFLVIFFLYNIFNSFFAEDFFSSFKNSISQIRFIFFAFLISNLILDKKNLENIFFYNSALLFLVGLDVLYQFYFEVDVFGFSSNQDNNYGRLSGPFNDELIVGSYLTFFSLPVISFYSKNFDNLNIKIKFYFIIFFLVIFFSILFSGERMAFFIFLFSTLFILFRDLKFKNLLIIILFIFLSILISYKNTSVVKYRFDNFVSKVIYFKDFSHLNLFSAAYTIWSENKLFGVGLKNFRIHCQKKSNLDKITLKKMRCETHPHNFHFEILVETGLLGSLFFLLFLVLYFKKNMTNFKFINIYNYPLLSISFVIFLIFLFPIKSTGSLFSTYQGMVFWYYFGLLNMAIKNKL